MLPGKNFYIMILASTSYCGFHEFQCNGAGILQALRKLGVNFVFIGFIWGPRAHWVNSNNLNLMYVAINVSVPWEASLVCYYNLFYTTTKRKTTHHLAFGTSTTYTAMETDKSNGRSSSLQYNISKYANL